MRDETGTKVDLDTMPAEALLDAEQRGARLTGRDRCVVHGDRDSGNIRMTADRVALIGLTRRTSTSRLDLVCHTTPPVSTATRTTSRATSAAWEAAGCWDDPSGTDRLRPCGSPRQFAV